MPASVHLAPTQQVANALGESLHERTKSEHRAKPQKLLTLDYVSLDASLCEAIFDGRAREIGDVVNFCIRAPQCFFTVLMPESGSAAFPLLVLLSTASWSTPSRTNSDDN